MVESTAALLKAGLAGAKILLVFIRLGVDFTELPAFAFSNSVLKHKQKPQKENQPNYTHQL